VYTDIRVAHGAVSLSLQHWSEWGIVERITLSKTLHIMPGKKVNFFFGVGSLMTKYLIN
jgi:hypothetical protein